MWRGAPGLCGFGDRMRFVLQRGRLVVTQFDPRRRVLWELASHFDCVACAGDHAGLERGDVGSVGVSHLRMPDSYKVRRLLMLSLADGACRQLSLQRWARMDPDNAVPWLSLAGKARGRHDSAAEADAFSHAATAHKSDSYSDSVFAFAEPPLLPHRSRKKGTDERAPQGSRSSMGSRRMPTATCMGLHGQHRRSLDFPDDERRSIAGHAGAVWLTDPTESADNSRSGTGALSA